MSKLFTAAALARLRANGEASVAERTPAAHHRPVLKIINPYGAAVWLLAEIDPTEPDHIYGLLDLGDAKPGLGWVSRDGLEHAGIMRGGYRLPLARDDAFAASYPLAVYARAARSAARINEHPEALTRAASELAAEWVDWPREGSGVQ